MSLHAKAALGAVLLMAAAPVLAQPAPSPSGPIAAHRDKGGMLSGLSPAGRGIMREAMRSRAGEGDRAALTAARQRMLRLIETEPLEIDALRRAMAEERRLADRQQQRRQEEMLGAFQRLSAEDRRAFAAGMRERHERFERMRRDIHKRVQKPAPPPVQHDDRD